MHVAVVQNLSACLVHHDWQSTPQQRALENPGKCVTFIKAYFKKKHLTRL